LNPDIQVEVISKKKGSKKVYSKVMFLSEYYEIKKKKGWQYQAYEIGFYQNKNKIHL